MERLPYIDQYSRIVTADRERTWAALLRSMCRDPDDLRTAPAGFAVGEINPPRRLTFEGHHRFSRYALVFSLSEAESGRTALTAESRAEFPGVAGRVYRALVIGSGGHRVMVRRLLRRIATAAERSPA
ncbi:hypothetical protein [Nocardia mexicana]|uniref:Polyketide cyclase/dehydrase/lipid transport protein n=1 Tax=Nocardia mexicana TaxID=279262 RepID=A0A370GXX9_9NOCA|nr:hypothetical protein [Nocardia mexicana]RDI48502.1 hypothetical protein DFR68_108335 [Nocardia mexicana]